MLIKKADVKNHLAAKLRRRHILRGTTIGQAPTEPTLSDADRRGAVSGNSQELSNPVSEFILPIRSSGGQ
jgi:hypothetical protein